MSDKPKVVLQFEVLINTESLATKLSREDFRCTYCGEGFAWREKVVAYLFDNESWLLIHRGCIVDDERLPVVIDKGTCEVYRIRHTKTDAWWSSSFGWVPDMEDATRYMFRNDAESAVGPKMGPVELLQDIWRGEINESSNA